MLAKSKTCAVVGLDGFVDKIVTPVDKRHGMGDNFDPSILSPERLRATVLDGLINREVMDQYAQDAGYRVTDGALLGAIRKDREGSFIAYGQIGQYLTVELHAGLFQTVHQVTVG